jgi:hypothetical protein
MITLLFDMVLTMIDVNRYNGKKFELYDKLDTKFQGNKDIFLSIVASEYVNSIRKKIK